MKEEVKKVHLDLQEYEVVNLLESLKEAHLIEISKNGRWEWQEDTRMYWYSSTKKSKQIRFTIKNITRQLNNKNKQKQKEIK